MAHLPGWDSLTVTTAIYRFFEVGGIVVLAMLVVFEAVAYVYGHHKTSLEEASAHASRQAELKSQQDAFDANLARTKREAEAQLKASEAKSNERSEEAEKKITELKAKGAPRRLSESQKAAILEITEAYPAQRFSVIYSNSAEADAQQFARDFDDVLGVHWNRIDPLTFNNFVPSPVGIWVCVSPVYAQPNPPSMPPAGARPLAETLFKLGIYGEDSKFYTMGNMASGIIWIVIGSRPVMSN
jgi:hypothetical protein